VGYVPQIHFLPPPQIEKLADRLGVIFAVPNANFLGRWGSLQRSPRSPS